MGREFSSNKTAIMVTAWPMDGWPSERDAWSRTKGFSASGIKLSKLTLYCVLSTNSHYASFMLKASATRSATDILQYTVHFGNIMDKS